jgi:hypothetical protein
MITRYRQCFIEMRGGVIPTLQLGARNSETFQDKRQLTAYFLSGSFVTARTRVSIHPVCNSRRLSKFFKSERVVPELQPQRSNMKKRANNLQ